MTVFDVSKAQKGLKISTLRKYGADGVIIRLGVGTSSKYTGGQDSVSDQFIQECENTNTPYGFYMYSYATNSITASEELNMFIGILLKYKKNKNFLLPAFLDIEENFNLMSVKDRTNYVQLYQNACKSNGISSGIYGNPDFFLNRITKIPKNMPIWLAHYFDTAPVEKSSYIEKYDPIGWQYGVVSVLPGYRVDINEWYKEV